MAFSFFLSSLYFYCTIGREFAKPFFPYFSSSLTRMILEVCFKMPTTKTNYYYCPQCNYKIGSTTNINIAIGSPFCTCPQCNFITRLPFYKEWEFWSFNEKAGHFASALFFWFIISFCFCAFLYFPFLSDRVEEKLKILMTISFDLKVEYQTDLNDNKFPKLSSADLTALEKKIGTLSIVNPKITLVSDKTWVYNINSRSLFLQIEGNKLNISWNSSNQFKRNHFVVVFLSFTFFI